MELPFLKNRDGGIMGMAPQPKGPEEPKLEEEMHPGLLAAADGLIVAIHSHDSMKVARALKDAHTISSTDEGVPSPESTSYPMS